MSGETIEVRFHPAGGIATATAGVLLSEAAVQAGLDTSTPCGGKGTCGKCRVRVRAGSVSAPTAGEEDLLTAEELGRGVRLACQTQALGDCEVDLVEQQEVVVRKDLSDEMLRPFEPAPRVKRIEVELAAPELDDQRSDMLRLSQAGALANCDCRALLSVLHKLPDTLREGEYRVAVTLMDNLLVEIEPLAEAQAPLGVAVDVGTTTVVAYLVNLLTGEFVAASSTQNPQTVHGADVISRIEHGRDTAGGLAALQAEIIGAINRLVGEALAEAGASIEQLYEMTVVGNTAMHHLLLGLDPQYIAQAPYIPVVSQALTLYARDVGIRMHEGGQVFMLPIVAGFVGADTVGVMTAVDICNRGPTLAVDIGTNGEIVLWSGERLLCASTAAGPAFEGAKISQGMYASPGAISAADLVDGDLVVRTIGDEPAVGLCGSALFDVTAVLLETGALGVNGRLAEDEEGLPAGIAKRMSGEDNGRKVLLASGDDGRAVYLTQRDIREIQLAKGAVRAGIEVLLEEAEMSAEDLEAVLLAGAFGNQVRPASAVRMGMLPALPPERIEGIGNAAGAGAVLALCSEWERGLACELATRAEHIELASSQSFQMKFMETMLFE